MKARYIPIIGLEIHAHLRTKTKMFCRCANDAQETKPNTNICPICTAQPGALPYANREAINWTVKTGLALNCEIPHFSKFDRKSYWYPDLPKGFQISQYDQPFCVSGYLDINVDGVEKRVRIKRIHLEEDVARSNHEILKDATLIDFNKAGIPMMELVTQPDLRSAAEVIEFLKMYQLILRTIGVADADMEKGQLRGEANVSVQKANAFYQDEDGNIRANEGCELYPLAEIKNLNSFKSVQTAVEFEIKRRTEMIERGEKLVKETLGWDPYLQKTYQMRTKEEAHDYRYFPEPDLPPVEISREQIDHIKATLPELPQAKKRRLIEQLGLKGKDAALIASDVTLAEFFEDTVSELDAWSKSSPDKGRIEEGFKGGVGGFVSSWLLSELMQYLKRDGVWFDKIKITPENLAELIKMVISGEINRPAAKIVLEVMYQKGSDPSQVVEEKGLKQMGDTGEIEKIVAEVIKENPQSVADYRAGKEKALQFMIGQVMKKSKGKANPEKAKELLNSTLALPLSGEGNGRFSLPDKGGS